MYLLDVNEILLTVMFYCVEFGVVKTVKPFVDASWYIKVKDRVLMKHSCQQLSLENLIALVRWPLF